MRVQVEVKQDYLLRQVNRRSASSALAELIWNALDGDSDSVTVSFRENGLGGLDEIRVHDDGHGITYDKAKATFGSLGDSWKSRTRRSPGGRELHGRAGEGRFASFALGRHVTWETCFEEEGKKQSFSITGSKGDLGAFDISDPVAGRQGATGTKVVVRDVEAAATALTKDGAADRFSEMFALYLRRYPRASISYGGHHLDPASVQARSTDIDLDNLVDVDGDPMVARLTIIEWKRPVDRALHFCDDSGVSLASRQPGIQAPGFEFTGYLTCDRVRQWAAGGMLDLDELHADVSTVVRTAKEAMREHFRKRRAEDAKNTVEKWKEDHVYPYEGAPRSAIEVAERQVFDVVALNINDYLPAFEGADPKSKKLSFMMLKSAIERSPTEAQQIIQQVLDLPQEKQEELAQLLSRTKLSAIINAAKLVGDRLDFLAGLDAIIFHHEARKKVKERTQLHRILAEQTWIFGEQFSLSVDDQALVEVLRKHLRFLGDDRGDLAPVTTTEGEDGIVDIMLSRRIPQNQQEEREHLVIELKRPLVRMDADAVTQIEKYAFAVADDERFRDTNTRWVFWLLSNDMTSHVRHKVTRQADRPDGMLHRADDNRITIWVKTWGQVLEAARARLEFFQKELEYEATHDTGLDYLRQTHARYLPAEMAKEDVPEPA